MWSLKTHIDDKIRHKLKIREDIDGDTPASATPRTLRIIMKRKTNCHKSVQPPAASCHRQFGTVAIDRWHRGLITIHIALSTITDTTTEVFAVAGVKKIFCCCRPVYPRDKDKLSQSVRRRRWLEGVIIGGNQKWQSNNLWPQIKTILGVDGSGSGGG